MNIISERIQAFVDKSKAQLMKMLLPAPNHSSRLQPETNSHEFEEKLQCFNSNYCNNSMQMADNELVSRWSNLPADILFEVAVRLPNWDVVRFAAVCKTWRLVIYGVHLPKRSTLLMQNLMSYTRTGDDRIQIEFLDSDGETYKYSVKHSHLDGPDPKPYASKYGWLLLNSKLKLGRYHLYLYNPFRNEVIQLPEIDLGGGCLLEIATFTTPPTSPNCVVFVLCKNYLLTDQNCTIRTCKPGERRWNIYEFTCQDSVEGVTYLDGIFYCIFSEINPLDNSSSVFISTFDIALQDWIMDYTSLKIEDHNESRSFYVVESINGKLLLAVSDLAHDVDSHWFLYQFDRSRKDWTMVRSLGHQALVLSSSSSIACATVGKDSKFSDMIFHLDLGPFTWSTDGVWRRFNHT